MMEMTRRTIALFVLGLLGSLAVLPVAWGQQQGLSDARSSSSTININPDELNDPWHPRFFKYNRRLRDLVREAVGDSLFSLAGAGFSTQAGRTLGADSTFKLGEVYVFPNPAIGGAKPTVHIEVGIADSVSIRIYNIAGQRVHEGRLSGPPGIVNGRYAYEYVWEGRIPNGVYLYAITVEKAGEGSRHKSGRFSVVR